MGYFIFIGILILFYVSLHGKTYQENKFNGRGIVFYQNEFIGIFHIQIVEIVQLFIFSTIASISHIISTSPTGKAYQI